MSGFNPNATLTVQVKAGTTVVSVTFNLANPACNFTPTPTPTPTATATPTATPPVSPLPTPIAPPALEAPNVNVYILRDEEFATSLSDAEKIARWNQGLPVAMTETVAAPLAFKPGLMKPVAVPLAQTGEGWVSMFNEDFVNSFPSPGQHSDCQLELRASEPSSGNGVNDYQWGYNNYRFYKVDNKDIRTGAAWPFAGGTNGGSQSPGNQTYPQNRRTQIICTFTGLTNSGMVSKGLNLPPNSNDDSWKYGLDRTLFTRLNQTNTKVVRLEFIAQPSAFRRLKDNTTVEGAIDLKHYDELIDGLCANQIATLGLLSYQMIPDKSWESPDGEGHISDTYLNTFTQTTAALVSYYGDRIRAWEVWNEPDYDPTGLAARDFVNLLIGVKPVIAAANDTLVSGGLGNVDDSGREFMNNFYFQLSGLQDTTSPFDVFGLHVYPSEQFVDSNGKLLLNPQQHWHQEAPNIFAIPEGILQGRNPLRRDDSDKDIWLTEFGWNGAKGSDQDIKNECPNQAAQWVTKFDQAFYLGAGFDILFKETAWPNTTRPAITKVFWYQYQDTSSKRRDTDCRSLVVAANPPSWWVSEYRRGVYPAAPNDILVNWWFGLFDGNLGHNPAFCPYTHYPDWATCYHFDQTVYLPMIAQSPAPGQ